MRYSKKATITVKQTIFIPAKSTEVYDALMDPKKHSAFTGSKATCQAKVGGKFTAWDGYVSGKNLKLQKGERVIQEWKTIEWPRNYPPSILLFTFKKKSGTELTMVQSKVPAKQANSYRQGWKDAYWNPLKKYFEKKSITHNLE